MNRGDPVRVALVAVGIGGAAVIGFVIYHIVRIPYTVARSFKENWK